MDQPKEVDKIKQVGHDINAGLKENVGVGFGNSSSTEDRVKSTYHKGMYEVKDTAEKIKDNSEKK